MKRFGGEKISPEEQQQVDNYFENPQLLSKDEAKTMMTRKNQEKIEKLMEYFDLQQFKDELNLKKDFGFLDITSNPKDFDIGPRGLKKVLKENTGSKPSMPIQFKEDEHCDCDFDVSADQIVIAGTFGFSFILAYIPPDQKYPEGMLRSELIREENENQFLQDLYAQLGKLAKNYAGKVDYSRLPVAKLVNEILLNEQKDK